MLLALAGIAWWMTIRSVHDMHSMVQGIGDVGRAMPFDMSASLFMAMWIAMMIAMMFPTVAPMVLIHRMVLRQRGEGAGSSVVFALGYLVVWSAAGLVPLLMLIGFRELADGSAWIDRSSGAVLVVAGLYQFSRWKSICLKSCRSPFTFLISHDFGSGARGALKAGISHGLFCFGCCWALMAVLFVVGLMNLIWMAGIAIVFLAEKNWRHGVGLTQIVGTAVIVLGIVVLGPLPAQFFAF